MTDEKMKPDEDGVTDEQLEDVSGGATIIPGAAKGAGGGIVIPDVCQTPAPGGSGIPTPFPNSGLDSGSGSKAVKNAGGEMGLDAGPIPGGD